MKDDLGCVIVFLLMPFCVLTAWILLMVVASSITPVYWHFDGHEHWVKLG